MCMKVLKKVVLPPTRLFRVVTVIDGKYHGVFYWPDTEIYSISKNMSHKSQRYGEYRRAWTSRTCQAIPATLDDRTCGGFHAFVAQEGAELWSKILLEVPPFVDTNYTKVIPVIAWGDALMWKYRDYTGFATEFMTLDSEAL